MKRVSISIGFLVSLLNACMVESTLFEGIRVDRKVDNQLEFTFSDLQTNFRNVKIEFNVNDFLADHSHATSNSIVNCSTSGCICYKHEEKIFLNVCKMTDHCVIVNYTSAVGGKPTARIDLTNMFLYGGAEHVNLQWPYDRMDYDFTPYVTNQKNYQAILEPYWLTSTGYFVYVDQKVPLFIELSSKNRFLSLTAYKHSPYWKPWSNTILNFTVCAFENARVAHKYAIENYLGKPTGLPDLGRVREPIWSTWVRYKADIDANSVRQYAKEIHDHGYGGQVEIDDDWEECYGSLTPNENKFENLKALVHELKTLDFRVTIWVHPFVNTNCMPTNIKDDYFVKNFQNVRFMHWWRGEAVYVDFTNAEAGRWYRERLMSLIHKYGIDSFKFDGGESSFSPAIADFHHNDGFHPETIVHGYVRLIASIGGNVHTRVARGTQKYPIFVTMMDRDSRWGRPLGLSTLIPQLLQLNMLGYSFVLPDMIGGNFYGMSATPELFVRWLQANVFMPSMQFSKLPWDFGEQATHLSKIFVDLHARYADEIIRLMQRNVHFGDPVNPPIWWIAPDDAEALQCDSEYLLGENLLVAPVLEEGAVERDIYLPKGTWRDENHHLEMPIKGPVWLRKYSANLTVLPYFTRISDDGKPVVKLAGGIGWTGWYDLLFIVPMTATLLMIMYLFVLKCLRMRKYFCGVFMHL